MTRTQLRQFWSRLLNDLEANRTISDARARKALELALCWNT